MPTLLLLRHGEIPQTTPRHFVGQRDLPLSTDGQRQAKSWRAPLATVNLQGVWTSDLARCDQTARLALGGTGPTPTPLPALREISLGVWEGLSEAEVEERFPGEQGLRRADLAHVAPTGGESFARLRDRVWPAVLDILARADEAAGPLLVVAHAGVNRALICQALGMPLSRVFSLGQNYASLSVLRFVPGRLAELSALNIPSRAAAPILRQFGLRPDADARVRAAQS